MSSEVAKLEKEVAQLKENCAFLVEYYKAKIEEKRVEKDKLMKLISR